MTLFTQHERSFLEAQAKDWGWRDNNAKIFVERMLEGNSDLSNQNGSPANVVKMGKMER